MESKKTTTIRFRVNSDEAEEIKRRAEIANRDMSTYIRESCLSDKTIPNNKQNAEIVKFMGELNSYLCYMAHQTSPHTKHMKEFHRRGIELLGSIQNDY